MQNEPNAKQQVVERIKSTTNILVTVSRNPSVDELSAALGLTLMLNKLDKHATAVFSGAVPPAIDFLEPGKTFENTTDSLRDFIIALDKEKADRLRYKVEEDVVRIFITPYKTTITDKDLNFSQGDFNVELIIALGVEKRDDIDAAVTAHGRILHDATVVTINASAQQGSIGSIDWSDAGASSLCEMLMSLSEALQSGILDQQMSTALLTGIVAATDRFRNEHTSPKVMTMAAQLMAAGANQQLIASKLEESHELANIQSDTAPDGSKHLQEGESEKLSKEEPAPVEQPKPDGEMTITHNEPQPAPVQAPTPPPSPAESVAEAEAELAAQLDGVNLNLTEDINKDLIKATAETPTSPIDDVKGTNGDWRDRSAPAPAFGGTLNATTDEAEEEKRREDDSNKNHMLLSHDGPVTSEPPSYDKTVSGTEVTEAENTVPDLFAEPIKSEPDSALTYEPIPEPHETVQDVAPPTMPEMPATPDAPQEQSGAPTLAELEEQARAATADHIDDARAAVDAALGAAPFSPAGRPLESVGAQPLGEEIRASEPVAYTQPLAEPAPVMEPVPVVDSLLFEPQPVASSPAPGMPPLPDFSTLPPLPGEEQAPHPAMTDPTLSQDAVVTVPTDPGQFKIPGQS